MLDEQVQRLVREGGVESYHGVRWRDEVISALTERPPAAEKATCAGYDTRLVKWPGIGPATEVLMDEGDMILFEPMSMHSASRCVNGVSRYCLVSSFFDDRVAALPHKLYQDSFHPAFLADLNKIAPELIPIVDWLPGFMRDYGDQVAGPETQFWAYGARTTGVDVAEADLRRNLAMLTTGPADNRAQDQAAAKAALMRQAEANTKRRQQQQSRL